MVAWMDPHNIFSLFLNKIIVILAPNIAKIFRCLIAAGSFLALWRETTQFRFRKGLGTTDILLLLTHVLQSSLDKRAESRIVLLDFSSVFFI